jgi:carbohydrate-selective porin OprB
VVSGRVVFILLIFLILRAERGRSAESQQPAQQPREIFPEQPRGMEEKIIAGKFVYAGETFANLSGGAKRGEVYEGLLKIGIGVNLEKLFGWNDAIVFANFLYPHGESFSQNYVRDLNVVSNIDAYDSVRLYELWYQQRFCDQRFSMRLLEGRIASFDCRVELRVSPNVALRTSTMKHPFKISASRFTCRPFHFPNERSAA